MKYFFMTLRYGPDAFEQDGFEYIGDNLFRFKEDGSIWKKKSLAFFEFDIDDGLCRLPELPFEKLISLAFVEKKEEKNSQKKFFTSLFKKKDRRTTDETYNFWGAISVLVDDYCEQTVQYISQNFTPQELRQNYPEAYKYLNSELNLSNDFLKKISDKEFVQNCFMWKEWLNK